MNIPESIYEEFNTDEIRADLSDLESDDGVLNFDGLFAFEDTDNAIVVAEISLCADVKTKTSYFDTPETVIKNLNVFVIWAKKNGQNYVNNKRIKNIVEYQIS